MISLLLQQHTLFCRLRHFACNDTRGKAIKYIYVFRSETLWELFCKMTLPCLLIASAPRIDLQAFIKGLVVRQGRGLWVAHCIHVCVREHGYLSLCTCVCVSEARPSMASRSQVPQSAVSLQLQSNRTATKCSVAKRDFPLRLAFLQPRSRFSLLFVFNRDVCIPNRNILKYISLQLHGSDRVCAAPQPYRCSNSLPFELFWNQARITRSALKHNDCNTCVCKCFSSPDKKDGGLK